MPMEGVVYRERGTWLCSNALTWSKLKAARCAEFQKAIYKEGIPTTTRNTSKWLRGKAGSICSPVTLDNHVVASGTACPKFSQSVFIDALVKFIVADNQSLNVIECQEFCTLLLPLHEGLTNDDIPHHMNTCKQIICAWEFHFQYVKENLANALGKISHTANI
ncbi:hypothetical protein K439DRAFT_1619843 [Ramaria rubella]|nr:hypothetical protein K439DRAFT_1619843 [Ramaria rubella]